MSALGQKQTLQHVRPMSALPPKADIGTQPRDVRFVPGRDERHCSTICGDRTAALNLGWPIVWAAHGPRTIDLAAVTARQAQHVERNQPCRPSISSIIA